MSPVTIRQLNKEKISERSAVAQVCQLIFCCLNPLAFMDQLSCILVKISGLPDEVEGYIAQGNVLFKYRSVACPLAVPVPKDQGIVSKMQRVMDEICNSS